MAWKRAVLTVPYLNGNLVTHRASEDVHALIQKRLAATWGGYSRTKIDGGYIMDDGSLAKDDSYQYEVITGDDEMNVHFTLHGLAKHAAEVLDQESVMFRIELLPQGSSVVFVRQSSVLNID